VPSMSAMPRPRTAVAPTRASGNSALVHSQELALIHDCRVYRASVAGRGFVRGVASTLGMGAAG